MTDQTTGTAAEEPSLRDTLASAFSETETEQEPQDGQTEPEATETPQLEEGAQEAQETPEEASQTEAERDEQGRFKAKEEDDAGKKEDEASQKAAETEKTGEEDKGVQVPPPGWSPTAKEEYQNLPDTVKQAIEKREQEVNQGLAKLQDYKNLDSYKDMAEKAGTTLDKALENYVAAEKKLEQDPVGGIQWLMQSYGVTLDQIGGQQPSQQAPQPDQQTAQTNGQQAPAAQPNLDRVITPLQQELNQLKEMVVGERTAKTQSEIQSFFDDTENHPYAENVADQMAQYIKAGVADDLEQAYEMACWNDPEIRGLLIKKQANDQAASQAAEAKRKADQARATGASITGDGAESQVGDAPPDNLRDHLEQQFAGGRV